MANRYLRRGTALTPGQTGTAAASPIYVNSTSSEVKFVPAASGTTEKTLVDKDTAQTLTNKTLTSPIIAGLQPAQRRRTWSSRPKRSTAAESGKTFYLDLAGGFVTTLPAVALGLYYEFIVKTAPTGSYTIVCPGAAALFKGHVLTNDVNSATDSDFGTAGEATITIVLNKAVAGDRVRVDCDGVIWHVSAECSVFDAITAS
jgi:hypothetical protein